ncbi:hypothetical protein [Halorhabdus tiamatea]|nr:hypothetical protein [Halorhabdus tiamatea]
MTKSVDIGNDERFDGADTGNSGGGGFQLGNVMKSFVDRRDEAQAACQAMLAGLPNGLTAWAEAGHVFTVEGDGSQDADIIVEGEYDGSQIGAAMGFAQSTISVHLENLSDESGGGWLPWDSPSPTEVTNTQVFHAKSYAVHWNWFSDEFEARMSADLEAGDKYYAYLKVHTQAVGETAGYGIANMHRAGHDGGYGKVDNIRIEWD